MEWCGERHMVVPGGLAVGVIGYVADEEDMLGYWKENGYYDESTYSFHKFNTAKELYLWMAEGEKE